MDGNRSKASKSVSTDHERRPTIFLRWWLVTLNPYNRATFQILQRATVYDTNVTLWRIVTATGEFLNRLCVLFTGFMHRALN